MLDARDAYLAADLMRFGGANQTELWHAFAKRGMGQRRLERHAPTTTSRRRASTRPREPTTRRSRSTPSHRRRQRAVNAKLYVGQYEARATPVADTDPATPLGEHGEVRAGHLRLRRAGARLRPDRGSR